MVRQLRENSDMSLLAVCVPDEICQNCPNLTKQNTCNSKKNQIAKKDKKVCQMLHLQENEIYTYRELQIRAKKYLDQQNFEEICGNCNWKKQGFCSYGKLMQRLPDEGR